MCQSYIPVKAAQWGSLLSGLSQTTESDSQQGVMEGVVGLCLEALP